MVTGQERQIFKEYYASEYFFDAKVFQDTDFAFLELEKIYRQTDPAFIDLLNKIRNKTITDADLEAINSRVVRDTGELPEGVIYLTTTNAMANQINEAQLEKRRGSVIISSLSSAEKWMKRFSPGGASLKRSPGHAVKQRC